MLLQAFLSQLENENRVFYWISMTCLTTECTKLYENKRFRPRCEYTEFHIWEVNLGTEGVCAIILYGTQCTKTCPQCTLQSVEIEIFVNVILDIILSNKQTTKALIKLNGCVG